MRRNRLDFPCIYLHAFHRVKEKLYDEGWGHILDNVDWSQTVHVALLDLKSVNKASRLTDKGFYRPLPDSEISMLMTKRSVDEHARICHRTHEKIARRFHQEPSHPGVLREAGLDSNGGRKALSNVSR